MRITIVLGAFFPVPPTMGGGVEKVWFTLAPEFVKRGHKVVMVSRKMRDLPGEETIEGVKHLRVEGFDTPRSLLWLKFLDLIYSWRTRSILPQADVIVTNTFWLPILLRDAARGRIYVHVGRYPKGQMRFYTRAARLQAPSNPIAERIATESPQLVDKVRTIPYPVTTSQIAAGPSPISDRPKIILYVGRVHPEKGVHVLMEAFVSGPGTAFADWEMMIVGPVQTKLGGGGESYFASLEKAANSARGKVTFAGPIYDSARLTEVYRSARLFVYPSLSERGESFGLAPLEAMAHGCAVMVSNLDCFRDFISDNETGFIFDHRAPRNAQVLREKMDTAIKDESTFASVAASGYAKSREYSTVRVAERFLEDFTSVTSQHV